MASVQQRIRRACQEVQRSPSTVVLVAVTKNRELKDIEHLYELGVRDFGESRLQEALAKIFGLPQDIVWHFIGNLQSNKARAVAKNFQVIHSITNTRQIEQISRGNKAVDVLVETNISKEPQKGGIPVNLLDETVSGVVKCNLTRFRGLMTVGPNFSEPSASREIFRCLRLENQRLGGHWLSMGMSSDFELAITEGSTHVRVGSALFTEA